MAKNKDELDLDALHADLTTKTDAEIRDQLSALQREANELDLEIKRESVAKIRAERANKLQAAQMRASSTKNFLAKREAQQNRCNHRKGGRGAGDVVSGHGNAAEYAVIKHRLPNGKFFVLCQRCGKEWHPGHVVGGIVLAVETPGYAEALNFPTDNTASGSSTFNFAISAA
jgi:hypothetical protein